MTGLFQLTMGTHSPFIMSSLTPGGPNGKPHPIVGCYATTATQSLMYPWKRVYFPLPSKTAFWWNNLPLTFNVHSLWLTGLKSSTNCSISEFTTNPHPNLSLLFGSYSKNPNQYILTSQTRRLDNNQSSSMAQKFRMSTQLNILVWLLMPSYGRKSILSNNMMSC
jgi:hypothetical protein